MSKLGIILIIDDDSLVLEALQVLFIDDYKVLTASSGQEGLDILEANPDIETVILDIKMAGMDGLETASRINKIKPVLPIIICTAYPGEYSETDIYLQYKVFGYVEKNEPPEKLKYKVTQAIEKYRLITDPLQIIKKAKDEYGMVGSSKPMVKVYNLIDKIAPTERKVMILGPTGTGKELVAIAMHKHSHRKEKDLIIFNCNQLPKNLVESELFGHEKGAFTHAIKNRTGKCELAHEGSLLLDEIGDLNKEIQEKILRVLDTGEFERIGSNKKIKVDIRFISATNRDLRKLVDEGKFREDLYYRLHEVQITMPSLSERREDIPELINFFIKTYCQENGAGSLVFEQSAIDFMFGYKWPGNVRQLKSTIYSLIDLSNSSYISLTDVENYLGVKNNIKESSTNFNKQVNAFKKDLIERTFKKNNGNISATAREFEMDPANLRRLMKNLGIE